MDHLVAQALGLFGLWCATCGGLVACLSLGGWLGCGRCRGRRLFLASRLILGRIRLSLFVFSGRVAGKRSYVVCSILFECANGVLPDAPPRACVATLGEWLTGFANLVKKFTTCKGHEAHEKSGGEHFRAGHDRPASYNVPAKRWRAMRSAPFREARAQQTIALRLPISNGSECERRRNGGCWSSGAIRCGSPPSQTDRAEGHFRGEGRTRKPFLSGRMITPIPRQ